jgi:phosphatidylglycerophosphate synthase
MLTPHKERFRRAAESVARIFIRLGFNPNQVTLFGLFLGFAACLFFIWNRNAVLFGALLIVCGLFDAVDGAVARLTNKITKFGSYLDAVCDRLFEAAAALASAYVSGHWALCFMVIVGIYSISYAKARAAMEIPVSNNEWPDFMERTERDVIFALGLIAWGLFPRASLFGHDIFFWVLAGLNLALYGTFLQRVLRAKRLIESRG